MADATLDGFRARFNEFAGTTDESVELALEEALILHSVVPLATLYAAAHLLKLDADTAAGRDRGGEVSEESAGPLKTKYRTQADTGADSFWTSTSYGRRFLTLEKRTPRHALSVYVA